MWSNFGLGNISQLGNQLGEALQRAKTELDSKLDQTFTFDEEHAPRTSGLADDGSDDFTVDPSGLFIPTGRPQSRQPATTLPKAATAAAQGDEAAQSVAVPTADTVNHQNGHARQEVAELVTQTDAQAAPVCSQAQHGHPAAAAGDMQHTQASASGQPAKKKVIKKKIIRKLKTDVPEPLAAAEGHVQIQQHSADAASSPAGHGRDIRADADGSSKPHHTAQSQSIEAVGDESPRQSAAAETSEPQPQQQALSFGVEQVSQQQAHGQQQQQQHQPPAAHQQHGPVDVEMLLGSSLSVPAEGEQQPAPLQPAVTQVDVHHGQQQQLQEQQAETSGYQEPQDLLAAQQLDQDQPALHQQVNLPQVYSYSADATGQTEAVTEDQEVQQESQHEERSYDLIQEMQVDGWGDQELDLESLGLPAEHRQQQQQQQHQQQEATEQPPQEQLYYEQQQAPPDSQLDQQQSTMLDSNQDMTEPDAAESERLAELEQQQQSQQEGEQQHETDTEQQLDSHQQDSHHHHEQQRQQQQQQQQQDVAGRLQQQLSVPMQQQPDRQSATSSVDYQRQQHELQLMEHQQQHVQQVELQPEQQQGQQQHGADSLLITRLQQQCQDLQHQLTQREDQLARQSQRLSELEASTLALSEAKAQLEDVVAALTAKNEQLVLRASKVNEQEMEEVQREAADRLAAAERKVFALIKERDALKRAAAAAASSSTDNSGDVKRLEAELQKKEELVAQLMDEGQKLSIRQMELESSVKKLRQQLKASDAEKDKLNALLAAERAESEGLRKAKVKADRDLVAAIEAGKQELEAVRQQGEEQLLKAQADKVTAEAIAAEAAAEGLAGQLRASEARAAALAESVSELQAALDTQRAAADLREETMKQDLSDLERRAQAAELRHQELSERLPEATAPLLRQITALQETATAQAQAWAAAERNLMARVHAAEAAAAAAVENEAAAQEQLEAVQARLAAAEQAAASAKASAAEAATRAARADERLAVTEQQLEDAQTAVQEAEVAAAQLREELKQQEIAHIRTLSKESAARKAAEEELTRSRQELSQLQGMVGSGLAGGLGVQYGGLGPGRAGSGIPQLPVQQQDDMWRSAAGPPALAAPGFKWILVPEGAEADGAANGDAGHTVGSKAETPRSSVSAGEGVARLLRQGSIASSTAAGAFFDTNELLTAQSDAASASAAGGEGTAGVSLSPANSSVLQLHQTQLRTVQQRLGTGAVGEAQLQRFRAALKQKVGECAALEARVRQLEETRDQLAGELVQATQDAAKASNAVIELPKLQQAYHELESRYAAAVELVGERDEQLEELANDLEDVKQLYRQQIDTLLTQVAQPGSS